MGGSLIRIKIHSHERLCIIKPTINTVMNGLLPIRLPQDTNDRVFFVTDLNSTNIARKLIPHTNRIHLPILSKCCYRTVSASNRITAFTPISLGCGEALSRNAAAASTSPDRGLGRRRVDAHIEMHETLDEAEEGSDDPQAREHPGRCLKKSVFKRLSTIA